MREWTFLTSHTGVLVCIARDPDIRLRDIAALVGVSERTVVSIVKDLTDAGYLVKDKDGRRTRYTVQREVPLRDAIGDGLAVGDVLGVLAPSQHGG
ncbi:MAG TPA: winged helix-turn-helix domain-containing protein [Solirubrobacteraceae bacterium]|nr:winged helix-turn-helix domain-containing protein [Solirubrobacteraceae bacterium]